MRKFPKLGIYVVMFTDIFKTFAQFFVVCFLFIVAFGLGFHILLYNQVSLWCMSQLPTYIATRFWTKLGMGILKPATHLAILYADRANLIASENRKRFSPPINAGTPGDFFRRWRRRGSFENSCDRIA